MDTLAGGPLASLSLTNNVCPELAERLLVRGLPLLIIGGGYDGALPCGRGEAGLHCARRHFKVRPFYIDQRKN